MKRLITTCLSNLYLVQESMGDKPIQVERAINFLNSQSKTQLQFAGIQDRADLCSSKEVHCKGKFLEN